MGNKYRAKRTYSKLCERWFASKAETVRGEELYALELYGAIFNLEYQPKFVLSEKPKITYSADFRYKDENGAIIIEDVKGVLTRDTRTKLAWVKEKYGVEVELIR